MQEKPSVAQYPSTTLLQHAQSSPVAPATPATESRQLTAMGDYHYARSPIQRQDAPPAAASRRPDNGGLPDRLRSGLESLSGLSMAGVKVHYNSARPARLHALAYAQDKEIHLGPGQERYLPHEAWHVVQQAQGRVRPTMQMQDALNVNDDAGLEHEADVMGARALQMQARENMSTAAIHRGMLSGRETVPDIQSLTQYKRASLATLQFGRRKKKARTTALQQEKQRNQELIAPYHGTLKTIGRAGRDLLSAIDNLKPPSSNGEAGQDALYQELYLVWSEFRQNAASLQGIQQATGLTLPGHDNYPVILLNAIEAVSNAQRAIKKKLRRYIPNVFDEIQRNRARGNLTNAVNLLDLSAERLDHHNNDAKPSDDDALEASVSAAFKGKKTLYKLALRALALSPEAGKSMLRKEAGLRYKGLKKDYANQAEGAVLDLIENEFDDFSNSAAFRANKKQILLLAQKETAATISAEYDKSDIQWNTRDFETTGNSARLATLFSSSPGLMEQSLSKIKREPLHQTLVDIKQNGKSHSIKDINDYVGDKLNEPLMRWVIENDIPVEVHAMSILNSFAKLSSEGYTDVAEVKSEHAATKKWVAINPNTQMTKLVFQTLPGQSYAIQTAGAFLFYEISDALEHDGMSLEKPKAKSMDAGRLTMFSEHIDYPAIYTNILKTYDVENADIACIGREGALSAALEKRGVTPKKTIDQAYFKGKVYILNGQNEEHQQKNYTLLTLSISPDFFGDKAGYLVKALTSLGVKHISFVGTAGGLAEDSAVGDVMAPAKLLNFSNGKKSGTPYENSAQDLLSELDGKDDVDMSEFKNSDLHVGVHSPITESDEMIAAMKHEKVASVDCEAGFMADALRGTDVSLYAFFFVGDVPGTDHSIGQGGVASELGEAKPASVAATELVVLAMLKKVIGKQIEQSDAVLQQGSYPLNGNVITGAHYPGSGAKKGEKAKITLNLVLPKLGADARTPGIVKNFHQQISAILDKSGQVLDLKAQNAINRLATSFYDLYKIKFNISYS
ncbi:MAG: DUF4157 domain-containing protein [Burkholderiales bacterium]|nr:DUF4157 domain-containing protein [Burkholderiales bacterium]